MTIDWQRVLPVIVSIAIIIGVAVARQYSRTLAAILATMPINVPLGMWVVYAGADGDPVQMEAFSRGMLIGIFPTVLFIAAVYWAFRAGWTLIPTLILGYVIWGVALGLSFLIRGLFNA
jgi:uncharacterized membrane protein YwzB